MYLKFIILQPLSKDEPKLNKIKFKSRKGRILELNLFLAQPLTKVDE
jgi:hypothetical protein